MVKLLDSISMQTGLPLDDRTIAQTFEERDNIPQTVRYIGMTVYVVDAKETYQLKNGITNSDWEKVNISYSSELITDPDHLTVSQTEKNYWNSKAERTHTHLKKEIKDFPESLKNPNSLVINLNNKLEETYDGSSQKSINITPYSIGTYSSEEIDNRLNSKADSNHSHYKNDIVDFPESLKNPNSLVIRLNNISQEEYDGSTSKIIDITPNNIGTYTSQEIDFKIDNNINNRHTHNANQIIEDTTHRFVSDNEKLTWNNKADVNHSHGSNNIAYMTGYSKAYNFERINVYDSLNTAVGKLERGLEEKAYIDHSHSQYVTTDMLTNKADVNHSHGSNNITYMTGYSKAYNFSPINSYDSLNTAVGKLEKGLDEKANVEHSHSQYAEVNHSHSQYATISDLNNKSDINHNHSSDKITSMTGYIKPNSSSAVNSSDSLNTAIGKLEKGFEDKNNNHELRIKKIEDRNSKVPVDAFSFKIDESGDLILEYNTEFVPNFSIKNEYLYYEFGNSGQMNLGKVTNDLTPLLNEINFLKEELKNMTEIKKNILSSKTLSGDLILTESYKNFDYLEILYSDDAEGLFGTSRIPVCDLDFAMQNNKTYELESWTHCYWHVSVINDTTFKSSRENSVIHQIRGVKMPKFTPKIIEVI